MKAYEYKDDKGKSIAACDIPADMKDEAQKLHDSMVESVVECDDDLMNKFFEGEEITAAELKGALKKGIAANQIKPMLLADGLMMKLSASHRFTFSGLPVVFLFTFLGRQ